MDAVTSLQKIDTIKRLNDCFRRSFVGGVVLLTEGVASLDDTARARLLKAVRDFSDFTPGNDPHGEHDMVFVEVNAVKYMAKVDYYDRAMQYHSPDPSDPSVTTRVLTVMRADEY